MAKVGDIYYDPKTGRTYKCISVSTITPTLINKHAKVYATWKDITYTDEPGVGVQSNTIVLEDKDGNQLVAVLVDEEVDFTATANDIREGKVAVTDDGVTVGEKYIPSYQTFYGTKLVLAGRNIALTNLNMYDLYDYTKLQAIVCLYNKNMASSVSSEMVAIDDNVYKVQSLESVAVIAKNHDNKTVDFNTINDLGAPCVVRYLTYKEVD